jgi:hypothetical protein
MCEILGSGSHVAEESSILSNGKWLPIFPKIGSAVSSMVLSPGMLLLSSGKWLQTFRTISSVYIFRVGQSYLKI